MDSAQETLLDPWHSMWLQPRATVRQLVQTDPTRMVLLLAAVAGVSQVLDQASIRNAGDTLSLPAILLLALFAGPLAGIEWASIWGGR